MHFIRFQRLSPDSEDVTTPLLTQALPSHWVRTNLGKKKSDPCLMTNEIEIARVLSRRRIADKGTPIRYGMITNIDLFYLPSGPLK